MTETLTDDHPLAVNMAAYISLFAQTEAYVQIVFEMAIGGDGTWSDAILHHVQSINTRIDIVEDFLKSCRSDTPLAKAVLPLVPIIRASNSYRNKLAHGVFASKEGGGAQIASNMFARKKKFKIEPITSSDVLAEYNKLQQLFLDLMHATNTAPPGFPRKFDFGTESSSQ